LLRFPVKGFSGLSLTFSEAFGVVVAIVLGIVSLSVSVLFVSRFRFQCRGVKYHRVKVSRYWLVKISWCQGVGVCCKDTGAFVGEFTLLLDFETFKAKHLTVYTSSACSKWFARSRGRTLYIKQVITKCKVRNIDTMLLVYIPIVQG
jgi:hypothetical protein